MFLKKQLFIELKTSRLTLAVAEKKIFRNVRVTEISNISVEPTIFNNGIIYNPSIISTYIKTFLKQQNLNKPHAIISIPEIIQKQNLMLTLVVLQTALCLSRAELVTTKIINAPLFDFELNLKPKAACNILNLLERLGSKKIKTPAFWLASILICLFISLTTIKHIRRRTLTHFFTLRSKIIKLKTQTEKLNTHLKDFSQIKSQNSKIIRSIKTLEKAKNLHRNPISHLLFISSKIPSNLYLTSINFNRKKNSTTPTTIQKTDFIEFGGIAENIQAVNCFIQKLSKNNDLFNKIEISSIKKIKPPDKPPSKNISRSNQLKYRFQASGQLTYG
jgi:Tfp pilus assembly protein PilN